MRPLIAVLLLSLMACQAEKSEKAKKLSSFPVRTVRDTVADTPERAPFPPIDYDTAAWAELYRLDSTILIDMKYASTENFVEEKMYDCSRCFLRPEVAEAVVAVQRQLRQRGLGLKMLDCFRPRPVQWQLWEKVPDPRYVANPRKGSMHNRGLAVDLTLVDSSGKELPMGTPYDFFGPEAHPSYTDLPDSVLQNRKLLRQAMMAEGFKPIRTEWWHFSYGGINYALSDMLWSCHE